MIRGLLEGPRPFVTLLLKAGAAFDKSRRRATRKRRAWYVCSVEDSWVVFAVPLLYFVRCTVPGLTILAGVRRQLLCVHCTAPGLEHCRGVCRPPFPLPPSLLVCCCLLLEGFVVRNKRPASFSLNRVPCELEAAMFFGCVMLRWGREERFEVFSWCFPAVVAFGSVVALCGISLELAGVSSFFFVFFFWCVFSCFRFFRVVFFAFLLLWACYLTYIVTYR